MTDDIERIKALTLGNDEFTIQADMDGETWSRLNKELETIDVTVTPSIEIIDTKGNMAHYERTELLFYCDPIKNKGCRKSDCYMYGGLCKHSTNPEYRRNDA